MTGREQALVIRQPCQVRSTSKSTVLGVGGIARGVWLGGGGRKVEEQKQKPRCQEEQSQTPRSSVSVTPRPALRRRTLLITRATCTMSASMMTSRTAIAAPQHFCGRRLGSRSKTNITKHTSPVVVRSEGSRRRRSSRRLRCDAAAGDGGAGEETFDGDLLANNAASLNGKLRTLVVGITDEQGEALINHRKSSSGTLFKQQRWIDGFAMPGQYMTITDVESGKSISKPISVSPYHARSTAPGSDVSVVELLLDTNSPNGEGGHQLMCTHLCHVLFFFSFFLQPSRVQSSITVHKEGARLPPPHLLGRHISLTRRHVPLPTARDPRTHEHVTRGSGTSVPP